MKQKLPPRAALLINLSSLTSGTDRRFIIESIVDTAQRVPEIRMNLRIPPSLFKADQQHNDMSTPQIDTLPEELKQLIGELSQQGTIALVNPGFSGGDQSIMTIENLQREQTWGVKHPLGSGLTDLFPDPLIPIITLMPHLDIHRPGPLGYAGALMTLSGSQGIISQNESGGVEWLPIICPRDVPLFSWIGKQRLYRMLKNAPQKLTSILNITISSMQEASALREMLEFNHTEQERGHGVEWEFVANLRGLPMDPSSLQNLRAEYPPGWELLPGQDPSRSSQDLSSHSLFIQPGELPIEAGASLPSRELIASMLGSADLHGEGFVAVFETGRMQQIRFPDGAIPLESHGGWGVCISGRYSEWQIESAFSFESQETEQFTRGLRQISTLQNPTFTHAGRAISDFLCIDELPGLIIDVRIQHPWVDQDFLFDSYIPWALHSTQNQPDTEEETSQPILVKRVLPKDAVIEFPATQLNGPARLFRRHEKERILLGGGALSWEIGVNGKTLRVFRTDPPKSKSHLHRAAIMVQQDIHTTLAGVIPSGCYTNSPARAFRGVQEHFTLVVCDPKDEAFIRSTLHGTPSLAALRSSWLIRS